MVHPSEALRCMCMNGWNLPLLLLILILQPLWSQLTLFSTVVIRGSGLLFLSYIFITTLYLVTFPPADPPHSIFTLLNIILSFTNSAAPQNSLLCEFVVLATLLFSFHQISLNAALPLPFSQFPPLCEHMLDPQATSVLISAVASSCTFSSGVDFISKSGGLISSNSGKINEKWEYIVETGCVKSLNNIESSVWWHFYHPKTLKNNGVNHRWKSPLRALSPTVPSALLSPQLSHVTYTHLLNPSIHLHWLQGQGLHNSSGSLIFGWLKLNMCQLDWTAQLEEHLISLWSRVRVLLKMQVQLSGSVPPCAVKGRAWGLSCAPFLQSSAELKLLEFWKIAFQLNSVLHLILCCASTGCSGLTETVSSWGVCSLVRNTFTAENQDVCFWYSATCIGDI